MKTLSTTLKVLTCTIFILSLSSLTNAQATRTWVSGLGDDVNPCSRTAPCKTYAGAISKTAAGGEISTLDPGGFGAVTITKSITINGTQGQGYGSILAAQTNGVIINSSTAVVRLRNLDINGAGNGLVGIKILAASKVYIEETVVDGFTAQGIFDNRNTVNGQLYITNTIVRNTTQSAVALLPVAPGNIIAMINNTVAEGSSSNSGFAFDGSIKGIIRNSSAMGNSGSGFFANGATEMTIDTCAASHNGTGITATAGAVVRLLNSTVTNNTVSIPVAGQPLVRSTSPGTNVITGNGTNNLPTGTAITLN